GWALVSGIYGTNVQFKTTKDGQLTEIHQKANNFNFGVNGVEGAEDRAKLEIEKLKLEVELLKRQLEKKN
ncbi:MAG: hypothetical protein JO332_08575, partial [Planctomycetaceae bacterium]|nr:hypothetical protein [Planctomycetaceae bacterium]